MNNLEIENNVLDNNIGEKQKNFLESNIYKAVNTGVDIGIRYLFPDVIEDEIIDIKDSFIQNGFKEGIKTAVDSAINFGKSALGIITGNFENVQQMQTAVRNGGIIDGVSNVINYTINKMY